MENISTLNKLTWPFQVLGLQCFSLKNFSKKPSGYFCFVTVFWIVWASAFVAFTFEDFKITTSANVNYLSLVIKFSNFTNYSTSIFICVTSTYLNHSKLMEFFRNSERISNLFLYEFNYKINFRRMKKGLIVSYLLYLIFFTTLPYFLTFFEGTEIYTRYVKPTFWLIIGIYIQIIVIRFSFYVRVVNFLLKILADLIRENFSKSQLPKPDVKGKFVEVWKVCPNNYLENRKVVVLRKIYLMIKEMADCINETMGLIIFIRLFMVITNMIRFGYDFLSDIYGSVSSLSSIWCKLLTFSNRHCMIKLSLSTIKTDQVFWLLIYTLTLMTIFQPCQKTSTRVTLRKKSEDRFCLSTILIFYRFLIC